MKFIFSLWLFLFSISAQAIDVFGQFDLEYDYFSQEILGREGSRPKLKASLVHKGDISKRLTFKLNPVYWNDSFSKVDSQKHFFDMEEGYLDYTKDVFSFKVGWMQLNWGVTESFDPTAVIHSYLLWDPLDLKSLSALGAHMQWSWSDSQLEIVVIPQKRNSRFPQGANRWLPTSFLDPNVELPNQTLVLPSDPRFFYNPSRESQRATQLNYGLRYYDHYRGLDYAFFLFEGAAPIPFTVINFTVAGINVDPVTGKQTTYLAQNIGLTPFNFRQITVGGTFVYSFDNLIIRYAGSYQDTIGDPLGPPAWSQSNVAGFEFTWLQGRVTTLIELSYIQRSGKLDNTITSISRLFDETVMLGSLVEINDNWSATVSIIHENKQKDQIYQVGVNGKLSDSFSVEASYIEIHPGGLDTALGGYNANDRSQLKLTYLF